MLSFLFLIVCANALVMHNSACDSLICQDNLKTAVKVFNSAITCSREGDRFINRISHNKVTTRTNDVSPLSAFAYTLTDFNVRTAISDFTMGEDSSKTYLYTALTNAQLKSQLGCTDNTVNAYFQYSCKFLIEYISGVQGMAVKQLIYSMIVRIPREVSGTYHIDAGPILEYGCDCRIDTTLSISTLIYKDAECSKLVEEGDVLIYGDPLCLAMFGQDDISRSNRFEITLIEVTYRISTGAFKTDTMTFLAQTKCSLTNTCELGKAYAIFDIIHVGELSYRMVAVLHNSRRVLEDETPVNRVGAATIFPSITVLDTDTVKADSSGASSSFVISVISLLALLATIL